MRNEINRFLKTIDLYDYLKIFRDKFFINSIEKELTQKRYNFYSEFIKEGDTCFDIGANYGNRTEIFFRLGASVIAVEPQPQQVKFLKRKFKEKIYLVEKAVASKAGKSILYISAENPLSSLSSEWISEVKKKRFLQV